MPEATRTFNIKLAEGLLSIRKIPKVVENKLQNDEEPRVEQRKKNGQVVDGLVQITANSPIKLVLTSPALSEPIFVQSNDFYEALRESMISLEKLGWLMLTNCGRRDAHVTKAARMQRVYSVGLLDLGSDPYSSDEDKVTEIVVPAFGFYDGWEISSDSIRQKHCQHSPRRFFDTSQYYF